MGRHDSKPDFCRPFSESLKALQETFEECSAENWDGYNAAPVTFDDYSAAKRFLLFLPETYSAPEISADPDGKISFDWRPRDGVLLSVSVGRKNTIIYAGRFGEERPKGVEYFGDEIPEIVVRLLDRALSN